jgi:hypothetical protein
MIFLFRWNCCGVACRQCEITRQLSPTSFSQNFRRHQRCAALSYFHLEKHEFFILNIFLSVLGIQIRMFLGLPDPDPLVRGTDSGIRLWISILPFSHKGVRC